VCTKKVKTSAEMRYFICIFCVSDFNRDGYCGNYKPCCAGCCSDGVCDPNCGGHGNGNGNGGH